MRRHFCVPSIFVLFFCASFALNAAQEGMKSSSQMHRVISPRTVAITAAVASIIAYSVIQQDIPFIDLPTTWVNNFSWTAFSQFWQAGVTIASESASDHDLVSNVGRIRYILSSFPQEELRVALRILPSSLIEQMPAKIQELVSNVIEHGFSSLSDLEIDSIIDAVKNIQQLVQENPQLLSFIDKLSLGAIYIRNEDIVEQLAALLPD